MTQTSDGQWELEIMSTWPTIVQLNVFGYDDFYYGDVDGDGVLDRLPPNTAAPVYCNLSAPPRPHISWTLVVNDADLSWSLEPRGQSAIGAIMYALLLTIPVITGSLAVGCIHGVWYQTQQMGHAEQRARKLLPDHRLFGQ